MVSSTGWCPGISLRNGVGVDLGDDAFVMSTLNEKTCNELRLSKNGETFAGKSSIVSSASSCSAACLH